MKKALLIPLSILLITCNSLAQCSFTAILTTTGNCLGSAVLDASSANNPVKIVWMKEGTIVSTVGGNASSATGVTIAGSNGQGQALDQFWSAQGIYVDAAGNVYVSDNNNARILKFPPGSTSTTNGVVVAGGNGQGANYDQFNQPAGMYIDAAGNLYVADFGNQRIMKWAPGATSGTLVVGGNGTGSAANQLSGPANIWIDGSGNLFVVDCYNLRVQEFPPGATPASNAVAVAGGNGPGAAANQFGGPATSGGCTDAAGNIYVSDFANNRVQKFPPGSTSATNGVTVAGGNGAGSGPGQLYNPTGVFVDAAGNVYVDDYANNRIQLWTPGATSGITVAGGNGAGNAANQLDDSFGVWVDAAGYIYATDWVNYRVQKWPPVIPPSLNTLYTPLAAGSYTAVITDANGCTATTNAIPIYPVVTPSVIISTPVSSVCAADQVSFTATPQNGGNSPAYQWLLNGGNTGVTTSTYTAGNFTNGDVVECLLTGDAPCATVPTALSNAITLTIKAGVAPMISITPSALAFCAGQSAVFTASLTNGGSYPSYQWQVNGADAGGDNAVFSSSTLVNGDQVTCIVTNEEGCTPAGSNVLMPTINPLPVVAPGQEYSISYGQSIQLQPVITGDIQQYTWTPVTGLSDASIADPVASPSKTTIYTLQVLDNDGCRGSGQITVDVFTVIRIPNAFTPNGDGRNDVFYVLGGPQGSVVKDLSIYNRWGQRIFQVKNAAPGDPGFGWDGRLGQGLAPAGTYVYLITVRLADGSQQTFHGTLELIR